ncbi:hypothetical protein HYZ05_02860 [Candidatus Daviesbacteria bacterium]|nr:hypothetical protein [Candidatus Daviesbacteria bacterium]
MKSNYKVLITTSGLGQRLGELTKYTNKSLIRIGKKPAISYIIEAYPKETEFVITVGHFGNQIKDFIKIAYPNLKVTFAEVDKYQGSGSSLGYSMLAAKKYLQCPFIFHASDTIVTEPIPTPDKNWNGGFKGVSSANYSTFTVSKNMVGSINDKGALEYDFIHIGLVGIKDFKSFWYNLESLYLGSIYKDPNDTSLNDCKVLNVMLNEGKIFEAVEFKSWHDIGNVDVLNQIRKEIVEKFENLDKPGEAIFIFPKFVIKFYFDKELVEKKIKRAETLKGLVPDIERSIGNFFRYKYEEGDLYSESITVSDFERFLNWCKENLWIKKNILVDKKFKDLCGNFYIDKTKQRVHDFLEITKIGDTEEIINGDRVPSVSELLKQIDFAWLSDGIQALMHGDLILENIIKTKEGYKLLDWRQDFGGNMEIGDMYYDLANLNKNFTLNHELVNKGHFFIEKKGKNMRCDILESHNLVECQLTLWDFIQKEGLDLKKVKVLTSLKWLSMSPLHPTPVNFNLFLYYFGRLNLYRSLKGI